MTQQALQSLLSITGFALAQFRTVNTPARASRFFTRLGYNIPPAAFGGALTQLATQAGSLSVDLGTLSVSTDDLSVSGAVGKVTANLGTTLNAMGQLKAELQANAAGVPNLEALAKRLCDYLRARATVEDAG